MKNTEIVDNSIMFYACIADRRGRILKKVHRKPMSKDDCVLLLRRHYWQKWLSCEAIPQPENMPGLHD